MIEDEIVELRKELSDLGVVRVRRGHVRGTVEVAVPVGGFLLPIADRDVIGVARAVVDLPT